MQNFMQIPPRGASRQMGEIYANFFIDVCEIFASIGGFRGWAIECCQLHFLPTDPRCHGNEIWNKIGYNSVCVRNICEIFASIGGFLGMGHCMMPIAFFPDRPPLPWQRNLGQNWL